MLFFILLSIACFTIIHDSVHVDISTYGILEKMSEPFPVEFYDFKKENSNNKKNHRNNNRSTKVLRRCYNTNLFLSFR